jgi:hypothetical protein
LPFTKGQPRPTRHPDPPASMLALLSGLVHADPTPKKIFTPKLAVKPSPKPPISTPIGSKIPPKPKPSYMEQLQPPTSRPSTRPLSYMELLRQGAYPQRVEAADAMMQATAATHAHAVTDTPLYAPLVPRHRDFDRLDLSLQDG